MDGKFDTLAGEKQNIWNSKRNRNEKMMYCIEEFVYDITEENTYNWLGFILL